MTGTSDILTVTYRHYSMRKTPRLHDTDGKVTLNLPMATSQQGQAETMAQTTRYQLNYLVLMSPCGGQTASMTQTAR